MSSDSVQPRTQPSTVLPGDSPVHSNPWLGLYWVAVKELKLSYSIGEALLFTIYTHYGNLI